VGKEFLSESLPIGQCLWNNGSLQDKVGNKLGPPKFRMVVSITMDILLTSVLPPGARLGSEFL